MNLIEKLGLEKCKAIVGGATELAFAYNIEDGEYVFCGDIQDGYSINDYDNCVTLYDLRAAIANHDTPTNKGTSIIDQFINSGGFDAAIQQQLQSELNNCSASNSSKNSIEDNCSDIRNHVSPNTVVTER